MKEGLSTPMKVVVLLAVTMMAMIVLSAILTKGTFDLSSFANESMGLELGFIGEN